MQIEMSHSNLIYYNNFFKLGSQVMFIGAEYVNFWSNGTHGNYWSDYKGTDLESDGVGDVPYYVTELNFDPYPLMTDPQVEAIRQSPQSQAGPGGGGLNYYR
jgi:nitrous oxidase accessory protein NosD